MRLLDLCKRIQTNRESEGSLYNPLFGIIFHFSAVKFTAHGGGNDLLTGKGRTSSLLSSVLLGST